jgi:hypothetical protein
VIIIREQHISSLIFFAPDALSFFITPVIPGYETHRGIEKAFAFLIEIILN